MPHSIMTPGESVASISLESTALPEWMSLAVHGYPDMSYKVDNLDLRQNKRTRIVKILNTPVSMETPRAKVEPPITKHLLQAIVQDLDMDFRAGKPSTRGTEGFKAWSGFDENEFKAILHSRAGGAHHSHTEHTDYTRAVDFVASLIFVSPKDDWPYVCFVATCVTNTENHRTNLARMLVIASDDLADTDNTGPAIVVQYLCRHIDQTLDKLQSLASIVEDVERGVQEAADDTILVDLIKQLHLCNVQHVRLQRRWTFQKQLMVTLEKIVSPGKYLELLADLNTCDMEKMRKEISYRNRLVQAAETDLAVLPRRIENQFTALYNLSNQRDAKASVKIATESAQIAQATLNDSSSMKTIAVMTLIFLPATFACSFFSMTFFNWQTASNRTVSTYLWVYFAVTVPVTIVVLAAWAFLTKKNRQENSARVGISQLLRRRTMERGQDLEKND